MLTVAYANDKIPIKIILILISNQIVRNKNCNEISTIMLYTSYD